MFESWTEELAPRNSLMEQQTQAPNHKLVPVTPISQQNSVVQIAIPSLSSVSRSIVSHGCRLRDDWQGSHRGPSVESRLTDLELFFGEPRRTEILHAQDFERWRQSRIKPFRTAQNSLRIEPRLSHFRTKKGQSEGDENLPSFLSMKTYTNPRSINRNTFAAQQKHCYALAATCFLINTENQFAVASPETGELYTYDMFTGDIWRAHVALGLDL
jgi:hypothetical protein